MEFAATSKKTGSVTFTACKHIQLRIENARIPWEPSVYGGDGSELRKNISFCANDEVMQSVAAMEEILDSPVSSCIKEDTIKCKISLDKVRYYDQAKNRIEEVKSFRGWTVNAMLTVRGKWETRSQSGLCLEVTDLQLLTPSDPPCPF